MRLSITRTQKPITGVLGGGKDVNFSVTCQVQLTPAEQELVGKYELDEYGRNFDMVLKEEREIREGCAAFKKLLDAMTSFGGQEVVGY